MDGVRSLMKIKDMPFDRGWSFHPTRRPGESDISWQESDKNLNELIQGIRDESNRYASERNTKRPWENEAGELVWSWWRMQLGNMIMSQMFEGVMGAIIMTNVLFIILEANQMAKCYPDYFDNEKNCPDNSSEVWWLVLANRIFLTIYCVEATVGLITFRCQYFGNRWNCLDFFVVVVTLLSEAVDGLINVAYMRMLRIARLMRAFRIVLSVRELYMLLSGLGSSIKAMFFGMILLMGMLVVWSIILVEFVHPINSQIRYEGCERCGSAYMSVHHGTLTLFQQIVAGDSWGTPSVRIIEERPILAVLLVLVVVTISLGVMNLILAVIVESAAEAREKDMEQKTRQKQKLLLEQKIKLLKLCSKMDADSSGSVSLDEIYQAWDESREFREVMIMLEVNREDMGGIFKILDPDKSGDVDYKEFVDSLYSLSTCDMRTMVTLVKMEIDTLTAFMEDMAPKLEQRMQDIMTSREILLHQQGVLSEQTALLQEIRGDQKRLSGGEGEGAAAGGDAQGPTEGNVVPAQPSNGDEGGPKPLSETLTEITGLRRELQESLETKAEIIRRAEGQEALLLSHAEVLMSVHAALLNPPGELEGKLEGLGSEVGKLRDLVHRSLAPILRGMERHVDEEVTALQGGDRILDAIMAELKLPPPPPRLSERRQSARRASLQALAKPGSEAPPPPETGRPAPFPSTPRSGRREGSQRQAEVAGTPPGHTLGMLS